MNPRTSIRTRLALAAAPLALAACLEQVDKTPPALPDAAYVFAVNVSKDHKTGSYAAYGLESGQALPNLETAHSDAIVRYHGGSDIFVINRLGRDNLQVVDRNNLKVVMALKFPDASNPQDLEALDGKLYVSFLAMDSILIYAQENGERAGGIDIHAYADSDGFAEANALAFAGGDLYALVQNLDIKTYAPVTGPKLLRIDVKQRKVVKAITLPLTNPNGMAYDPASGKIYIACTGAYFDVYPALKLDGGIVSVDLAKDAATVIAKEEDLGGNVGYVGFHSGKLFFAVNGPEADQISVLTPNGSSITPIVKLDPYKFAGLGTDAGTNSLVIGDQKAGLRLFRLDTFQEKEKTGIDLGATLKDLVIIR